MCKCLKKTNKTKLVGIPKVPYSSTIVILILVILLQPHLLSKFLA